SEPESIATADPFVHGSVGSPQSVAHCHKKRRSTLDPMCTPVDWIGFDWKARLAEHTDRARHVIGGCHQQPALTKLGLNDCFGKDRIFCGIARPILKDDATWRDPETDKEPCCEFGLRGAVIDQRAAAAQKQDAGIGIAPQQLWHDKKPFVARTPRIDGTAAKHDDAVRCFSRRIPRREAIFQRRDRRVTTWGECWDWQAEEAR